MPWMDLGEGLWGLNSVALRPCCCKGLSCPSPLRTAPSERPTLSGLKPCAAFGAYSDDAARVFQR